MVEFALVSPMFFLVLLGILVVGLVVVNQTALQNRTRDAVRGAAICGDTVSQPSPVAFLPNGTACSQTNVNNYITTTVAAGTGSSAVTATLKCFDSSGNPIPSGAQGPLTSCATGDRVELSTKMQQPTFIPFVGIFFANNGSTTTRTLNADASAICEQ
jgi:Flp pilus assembly protein TadG